MKLPKLQIGFIGGSRITNILLNAWEKHDIDIDSVWVFDTQAEKSEELASRYPGIKTIESHTELVKNSRIVFLAIHPQEFPDVLNQIKNSLSDNSFVSA